MRNKQSGGVKKRVLEGYKKVGSTFIPPILHRLGPVNSVSWAIQSMPELIWWDALIDRTSHRFAVRVSEAIARYFKSADKRDCWWAFISNYAQLSGEDIDKLREHLRQENVLTGLQESLVDLINLYPECPLSRLFDRLQPPIEIGYLDRFEARIRVLEDKRSRDAVLVQAQAVYMGFILGKLRVKQGLALADFPEVENYPDTERSEQVGAAICATVNGLAGRQLPNYIDDKWVQYFWQRNLELRPLDFSNLEHK